MGWLGDALDRVRELIGTRSQRRVWKERILDRMYDGVVFNYVRERGIRPRDLMGEPIPNPTIKDYKDAIMMNAKLDDLILYCEKERIPIKDIRDEIDKNRSLSYLDTGDRRRQSRLDQHGGERL